MVQRVSRASVKVDGETIGAIESGLLVFWCALESDTTIDADYLIRKIASLRIFEDEAGRMNKSLKDTGGRILLVSQFTLAADTRKGNRPSFSKAMPPEQAREMIQYAAEGFVALGLKVEQGQFGAHMQVEIQNDGPVTMQLDSSIRHQRR